MNGIALVIIAALILTLAYRFYGAFMAAKVLALDPGRATPAVRLSDGRDYVPTNKWVTFGHHFAAIAGAGPLVGPVLAAQFGYLPGTLWLLIGAVVAGAVHDMVILFASIRHDGLSVAEIAKKEISKASGLATSIAVLFILIITMAGLGIAVVNALYDSSWGTFTVAATIPIAIFVGLYLRYIRPGHIGEGSLIGVTLVLIAVFVGPWVQQSSLAPYFTFSRGQLSVMMAVYGFVAAALPVWLLLAPRDYLSTYMKIGTILALAVGIIIVRPEIHMPAVTPFINGGGPIIPGPVWPFMFITIACGAISGFHALISTGTTPKMLANEAEIRAVGFGGMLVESFVALMALIAATSLYPADYFAINTAPAVFAKLGMQVNELPMLSELVGENVAGRPGGAVSLAVGMAHIFAQIPGMNTLLSFWYHFAIMFEALFILTTIDAGTRVGRYLIQELGGMVYKPLKNVNWVPGIIFSSAAISFAWGYLLYGGSISTIWPLFGVANQLLATMSLAIGTTVLFRMGKGRYAWTTIIPMSFLGATTVAAGYLNITTKYLPKNNYLLAGASAVMIILVIFVIADAIRTWLRLANDKRVSACPAESIGQ
ncbi:carbon starvation protein CstA [Thermosinus carboxydivorans Nor1]|uniref:Carbon starvation protein CstA n=1 Tax=Thermosinus carboxydivorans Nor1 TaxID=401526 RepID=A1HNM6_9FIRM|nr:carbon starvation protein A [Thermosinus carboxydivorans]EAX48385.1 carbon starvation protein CstA [Thermosinus carboxydivorans Nor1]